jgi:hypothetical protein
MTYTSAICIVTGALAALALPINGAVSGTININPAPTVHVDTKPPSPQYRDVNSFSHGMSQPTSVTTTQNNKFSNGQSLKSGLKSSVKP